MFSTGNHDSPSTFIIYATDHNGRSFMTTPLPSRLRCVGFIVIYGRLHETIPRVCSMPQPNALINLLGLTELQMIKFVRIQRWPDYRAGQILRWLYQRRARAITQMTDLSTRDRLTLTELATIHRSTHCPVLTSQDGTRKLLLTLDDGMTIETVLIPDAARLTLCVSTQVGCMLDCGFCLTGTMGLHRNLKSYEIVDQVLTAQDRLAAD